MKKTTKKQDNQTNVRTGKRKSAIIKTALFGVAFGLCASAIVGLSVALYFAEDSIATHKTYQRQMDAVYSRAYYDLLDGASDLGVTLRKIGVSNSKEMQQSLLYEVWGTAQLAEDSLGMFESQDDGILQAQKFVNQLGDYSHTLALRMADGQPLRVEERQKLLQFGEMADVYKDALEKVRGNLDDGKMFMDEGGALDSFESAFSAFSDPSFNYPEMIYDGPFSSALENRTPRGLSGENIDVDAGERKLLEYFSNYEVADVRFEGEGQGNIPTLNYIATINGATAFVQLSKQGGMLVALNSSPVDLGVETAHQDASLTCQNTAVKFVSKVGFGEMQVVWSSSADGECVVNLAPVQDGVILYPDLVKVKIDEASGLVIGADATHYIYNHHERALQSPKINIYEAKSRLSMPTEDEGRLTLIPLRETKEVLAYEFECEQNGTYYVYVDAISGEEANILYVIDDDMGTRTI